MAKVFSFTSVLRKNMMEKDKPDLYYALAKSSGEIDIDEMAERIQRSSTVNWADVVCVLRALQTEMIDSFKKGEIVRLGNIGSFYVTLRSNGVLVQKDVKEGLIKGARVRFRPGKEIKDALKTLDYSKYKPESSEGDKTDPENPKPKPDLYYALAKSSGEIDIDEMAERIQRSSTVNWADVVCVLRALQTEMIDSFKKGEIVRLGNIGSFYVTLRSNGVLVQKDVKEGLIKGARVRFRPGKEIKDALKTLDFSKYKPENSEGDKTDPENPKPKPDPDDGDEEAPDPTV